VRAVQRAADSVVSIYVVHATRPARGGDEAFAADGQGSGVILDESGLVISNWHVVAPVAQNSVFKLQVKLRSGKSYFADLLSSSPESDLALLQLRMGEGEKVKPVTLGDSDSLMVGEDVLAVGNPQGNANSVSKGILSAIDRSIMVRAPDGSVRRYSGLIQTDAAINPGNSGGALLDITGKLVGINNAMAQGAENIGFAIPVNTMRRAFENVLLSAENLASVWTGFKVKDVDGKAQVVEVHPYGPAARADLHPGDVLVKAEGEQVTTAIDYARRLVRARAGKPIPLVVERRGKLVQVAPVPLTSGASELARRYGVEVEEVTRELDANAIQLASRVLAQSYGIRRATLLPVLLRVRGIYPDSPLGELKLKIGDILLSIPGSDMFGRTSPIAFRSAEHFALLLRQVQGDSVKLDVLRGEELLEGEVTLKK